MVIQYGGKMTELGGVGAISVASLHVAVLHVVVAASCTRIACEHEADSINLQSKVDGRVTLGWEARLAMHGERKV
jgi:hypothetical protein